MDYDDLFQTGVIGLIKAYKKYDPNKINSPNPQFSTYAVISIQGEILQAFRDNNPGAKFPRDYVEIYIKISKADLLDEPIETICEKLNLPVEDVQKGIDYHNNKQPVSMQTEIYCKDGDSLTVEGLLENPGMSIEDQIIIKDFLKQLKPRERQIAFLINELGMNQTEVAKIFGVSHVQICREIKSVYDKARKYSEAS
jgi:RNA polymerase sporulation-specific sigma factor